MSLVDSLPKARRKIITYGNSKRKRRLDFDDAGDSTLAEKKRPNYHGDSADTDHFSAPHMTAEAQGLDARNAISGSSPKSRRPVPETMRQSNKVKLTEHPDTAAPFRGRKLAPALEVCESGEKARGASKSSTSSEGQRLLKPGRSQGLGCDRMGSGDTVRHLDNLQSLPTKADPAISDPRSSSTEPASSRSMRKQRSPAITSALPKHDGPGRQAEKPRRGTPQPQSPRKRALPAAPEMPVPVRVARSSPAASTGAGTRDTPSPGSHLGQSAPAPSQSKQAKAPRLTYAAKSRTILSEASSDPFLTEIMVREIGLPKSPSKRELRIDQPFAATENDPLDVMGEPIDDAQAGSLRSVRELRQAGVNARTEREIEALIDDISSSSTPSQRQAAFLDLAIKSQAETFLTQVAANGLASRIHSLLRDATDDICKIFLASASLRIISSAAETDASIFNSTPGAQFLETLLANQEDVLSIVNTRKYRLPRASLADVAKLCHALLSSSAWTLAAPSCVTPRVLCLQCLSTLLHRPQQVGGSDFMMTAVIARHLVAALDPLNSYEDASTFSNPNVRLSLTVLEAATQKPVSKDLKSWTAHVMHPLGRLVSSLQDFEDEGTQQAWIGALRVLLNLTNNDVSACDEISNTDSVSVIVGTVRSSFEKLSAAQWEDEQDTELDRLVLSLGVLINLAETSRKARLAFAREPPSGPSTLSVLLEVFRVRLRNAFEVTSEQGSRLNVAFGYLAVVLVCLCMDDLSRRRIAAALEDGTLRHLVVTAREFLSYHCEVAKHLRQGDPDDGSRPAFVDRLQVVVGRIEQDMGT